MYARFGIYHTPLKTGWVKNTKSRIKIYQNYILFPIQYQSGLPQGNSFLVDAFHMVYFNIMFYCLFVFILINVLLFGIYLQNFNKFKLDSWQSLDINYNPYVTYDNWIVELVFILLPCFIVFQISIPSISLLYSTVEFHDSSTMIKITGQQWAWKNELIVPWFAKGYYNKRLFNDLFYSSQIMDRPTGKWFLLWTYISKGVYTSENSHLFWLKINFVQEMLRCEKHIPGMGTYFNTVNIATIAPAQS